MKISFNPLKPKKSSPFKIAHNDQDAVRFICSHLGELIANSIRQRELIVVCIGTDRSTGDALGPLVGTYLRQRQPQLCIYGTLHNPVHAMNLVETLNHIQSKHHDPFILAVDACLGQMNSVGSIQVCDGPVKPGAGVNKQLPAVGNAHITGIVNVGGFMEYFVLQNTRLSLIYEMAQVIAASIDLAFTTHTLVAVTRSAKQE